MLGGDFAHRANVRTSSNARKSTSSAVAAKDTLRKTQSTTETAVAQDLCDEAIWDRNRGFSEGNPLAKNGDTVNEDPLIERNRETPYTGSFPSQGDDYTLFQSPLPTQQCQKHEEGEDSIITIFSLCRGR